MMLYHNKSRVMVDQLHTLIQQYLSSPSQDGLNIIVDYIHNHREHENFSKYYNNHTLLTYVAKQNNLELTRILIQEGFSNVHERTTDSYSDTALTWFAFNGNLKACKFLYNNGANINDSDTLNRLSVFMWAISKGGYDVAIWLLSIDTIDTSARDALGRSMLWYICKYTPITHMQTMVTLAMQKGVRDYEYEVSIFKNEPFIWVYIKNFYLSLKPYISMYSPFDQVHIYEYINPCVNI
jgi:hypothetical protein